MATAEEAKKLAGSTLATKSVRLQTEYLVTRTKITVHGIPINISGDRLGAFFAQYGDIEVSTSVSKAGIATRDFIFHVTLTRKSFGEILTH